MIKNYYHRMGGGKILLSTILSLAIFACSKGDMPTVPNPEEGYRKISDSRIMYTFDNFKRPLDAAIVVGNQYRPATKSATPAVGNIQYIISSNTLHDSADGLMRSVSSAEPRQDTVMYVINYANNGGFAIVSTDYRTEPVIALSQSGSFDVNNMNPGVEFVIGLATDKHYYDIEQFEQQRDSIPSSEMQQLKEQYSHYQLYTSTSNVSKSDGGDGSGEPGGAGGGAGADDPDGELPCPPSPAGGTTITEDYLVFPQKYHQVDPFNLSTPKKPDSDGKMTNTLVGCVTVAIAQIIVYHKYPEYVESMRMPWDKMATSAYTSNFNQVKDQINYFLRKVGDRADNNWGLGSTSATDGDAKNALQYYGYNSAGPNNLNEAAVQQSIKDKRPVYMAGYNKNGSGGHAWVVEGVYYYSSWSQDWIWNNEFKEYELGPRSGYSRTMYRCNWGWGGNGDALFYVSSLAPNAASSHDYSRGVTAITNIRIN